MVADGDPYRCVVCGTADPLIDHVAHTMAQARAAAAAAEARALRWSAFSRLSATVCLIMAGVNLAYTVPRIVGMFAP